ncbi:putative f-box domain protein [Mycena venus]|uniref:Putative f-box domain protein n=1 Tax=Mycena venus TaxID=2733690 RepID=A0A8H6U2Q9_9AGAR|nr:putative f-box domain protein [Mycena venus]
MPCCSSSLLFPVTQLIMPVDVRCTVCGGPPLQVHIAEKSPKVRVPRNESDSEDSDPGSDDEEGYDPQIVSEEDVEWIESCALLGFNKRSTAIDKMYLTGRATYDDYGCFNVDDSGEGMISTSRKTIPTSNGVQFPAVPNSQCITSDDSFVICDATQTSCYPIHPPCLQLLTRVLCGNAKIESLDKDILYHTMSNLHDNFASGLDLDYGEPESGFDQTWYSNSGAEMLVINPMATPSFTEFLRNAVSTTEFTLPPPSMITSRVQHDPFATIPYDVAHALLLLLPLDTVIALCAASYPIHAFFGPSNRAFWRAALFACMPWFWELHELVRDSTLNPKTTDYKGLFLWADKHTMPREGLHGPFMGVANRRRIWGVCLQLAEEYNPRAAVKTRERLNVDLPAVLWPKPKEKVSTRTATAQWICDEMSHTRGGVFEAFWGKEGSLVGMVFTVVESSERSVFGEGSGSIEEAAVLETGIAGLVLHLPDIFLHEKVETSIRGITVLTASGESHRLGDTSPQYCQRILSVNPNHGLTGIVGHITNDGQIFRIGLLQHPLVEDDDDGELAPALLHRPLWKGPTSFTSNALHNTASPIWSHHPRLQALPSTTRILNLYQIQAAYHEDVVPIDVLVWAADARELKSVRRISAYQPGGDRHVGVLRVDFTPESGIAPRVVGEEAGRWLVDKAEFNPTWDNSGLNGAWVSFAVDGPGGEVVVGVDAVHDEELKTVRLRTNRGREVIWGEELRDYRTIDAMEPADGETIVGLAVGFVNPCYDLQYRYAWSTVSALTMVL